ncbi:transcriptional regulator [Rhodococcus sp. KBW08]|uniref:winged helix-turn-helix transcriptional regulator n=1 Tax=Rhodococcus sp. KBW08 TaxID=2144188 RepID=UPI000F5A1707|nr:helix-turn-helix domain-containing protein [Rhodococcus sp. KBW08]RQO43010.1 transcriptional regulator [Rhodococcus sp. KBW08]
MKDRQLESERKVSAHDVLEQASLVRIAFQTIADTWSMLIMLSLQSGTLRYNEIKRAVGGVSERRLSQTLKQLERDGVVNRKLVRTLPAHVEYSLTSIGEECVDAFAPLVFTILKNSKQVAAARQRYDELHP